MKRKILENKWKPGHARGRRGRTTALIATVAICACTAVRLDAVVIDDFEGPVKFDEGGGGTNEFIWGLTNGQLVVYTNAPNPEERYDNVYWPAPLTGVSLEGGRTLELRMDLNHTSADDLFLLLMCACTGDDLYGVFVDRNEVALCKYRYDVSLHFTTFYWDTLATTNENVTVKLAFTKTNSSLAITVKVVDKGNQRRTLYERTFVDGPGQDGPVIPPDPHGLGVFTPDAGGPYTNFAYAAAGCWRVPSTIAPPLEMLLDNLEYDVYYPPHLEIAPATNGVALDWRLPMDEHIVVEADQLAGDWCPCPQPHTRTGDVFCLTMPCQAQQKFFKLTPGRQFTDGFSGAELGWTPWANDPGEEWIVTNGVLQVSFNDAAVGGLALVPPPGTNVEAYLRDFCTSVDIVDWETTGTTGTNWSSLALVGRGKIRGPNWAEAYFGGLTLNADGIPGNVKPWMHNSQAYTYGSTFDMQQIPLPYRLQFSVVGTHLSFRVLSLTTGQLIQEMILPNDSNLTNGFVGLWISGRSNDGDSFTAAVDNFFLTGTKP